MEVESELQLTPVDAQASAECPERTDSREKLAARLTTAAGKERLMKETTSCSVRVCLTKQPNHSKVFERDADGRVFKLLDRRDNNDLVWKKTKYKYEKI